MIYFDNAATTKISDAALTALIDISKNQYGNASSIYKYGREAKEILEEARDIIARCIGADTNEIFFTSGGTESDNWVINQAGSQVDYMVVSEIEHHAVLNPVTRLKQAGMKVSVLPVNSECFIEPEKLKAVLTEQKALVSVMLQNNETGVIQDIPSLVRITREANPSSLFHTDAVQAVGHRNINVHDIDVDMLSASAHKFNGPKGVGFLYMKRESLAPFILGGGQERGWRAGTENLAGIYSMAIALEENIKALEENEKHIEKLEKRLYMGLSECGISYTINGSVGEKAIGVINISIDGIDGEGILNFLDMHDICVSIGSACNSKRKEPSHVLLAMGISEARIDSSIRISIGKYNSEDDVDNLIKWIARYKKAVNIADS